MNRETAVGLLDRLHQARNEFYSGGSEIELRGLLSPHIAGTVPEESRIAGHYRGVQEVFDYFRRRRELARRTSQLTRRDVGEGFGSPR